MRSSGVTGRAPCLVLGLGNTLFGDEGVGVAAADRLVGRRLPGIEVLDGGTLGIALLPQIEGRDRLLVLDAVLVEGAAPGEIITIRGDDMPRGQRLLISAHQVGIAETLDAAELSGQRPADVAVVGMVPASLDTGHGLSPTVAARLDAMVDAALAVLDDWGVLAHA